MSVPAEHGDQKVALRLLVVPALLACACSGNSSTPVTPSPTPNPTPTPTPPSLTAYLVGAGDIATAVPPPMPVHTAKRPRS